MIRSLTIGVPVFTQSKTHLTQQLIAFNRHSELISQKFNLPFRTTRLTLPAPDFNSDVTEGGLRSVIDTVRDLAASAGARWYCLPINLFDSNVSAAVLDEVLNLIVRDSQLFVNLIVAKQKTISIAGAYEASKFITNLSRRSSNGIDNFRLGVSAACNAGTPFFPFSRHEGAEAGFSIALETTDSALSIAERARKEQWTLSQFQDELILKLQSAFSQAEQFGRELEAASGVHFLGIDGSFAPFPDGKTSVASVIESLGPTPVGCLGTVFMTSVLTDAIKVAAHRANATLVGFNGVMFSVLEDNGLTHANNLRALSLEKLALFSTVCGCGIDMVPIPSTTFSEDIAGLILDISALAIRLNKPLGVRLLPIPNKSVNEYTQLNLDFLCDGRVMETGISASKPILADAEWRYGSDR
jgi:uncharacterized protein (UPF0210 family)